MSWEPVAEVNQLVGQSEILSDVQSCLLSLISELQSGASSRAKHGGAYFSAVRTGSKMMS